MKTYKSIIRHTGSSFFLLLPVVVFLSLSSLSSLSSSSTSSFYSNATTSASTKADGCHGLTYRDSHLQTNAEAAQYDISKHISHHNSIYFITSSIFQFSERPTRTKNIRQHLPLLKYRWAKRSLSNYLF